MKTIAQLEALGIRKGWILPRSKLGRTTKYKPNKTNRRRGLTWAWIRWLASNGKQFTWRQLCPPLEPNNAEIACIRLAEKGELMRVVQGKRGRGNTQTVYGKQPTKSNSERNL